MSYNSTIINSIIGRELYKQDTNPFGEDINYAVIESVTNGETCAYCGKPISNPSSPSCVVQYYSQYLRISGAMVHCCSAVHYGKFKKEWKQFLASNRKETSTSASTKKGTPASKKKVLIIVAAVIAVIVVINLINGNLLGK